MKKIIVLILAVCMTVSFAIAESIDLSGMSFSELVALKERIDLAIWKCQEWQEVTVPKGLWKIGEDIPAGHWTLTPVGDQHEIYYYGDKLDETGTRVDTWESSAQWSKLISTRKNKDGSWKYTEDYHEFSAEMKEGFYLFIPCDTIFTPYAGKPGLGFK